MATKLYKRQITIQMKVAKNRNVPGCDHAQFLIQETDSSDPNVAQIEGVFDGKPKIAPETFAVLFPFHVLFDKELIVRSVGSSLARVAPILTTKGIKLNKTFEMIRPNGDFNFDSILSHLMTVYVLRTSKIMLEGSPYFFSLKLKGQMFYLEDQALIIFLCSPSASSLFDLTEAALSLGDFALHDASKDLLISETFAEDYRSSRSMELMTENLQQKFRHLESEQRKMDNLMYSTLPAGVARELRHNRPVIARKYDHVTVLFCGISNFAQFCTMYPEEPVKVMEMLNEVHLRFDALIDPKLNPHLYKVMSHQPPIWSPLSFNQ